MAKKDILINVEKQQRQQQQQTQQQPKQQPKQVNTTGSSNSSNAVIVKIRTLKNNAV